jgi:hypothetical protein
MNSSVDHNSNTFQLDDLLTSGAEDHDAVYAALMTPSNNSGVLGAALVQMDDDSVTVDVRAIGLTPGEFHPLHIHGFLNGDPSHLPTLTLDADRDGFIETPEGELSIGSVLLSLAESGTTTNEEVSTDFPRAASDGTLSFHQTYNFDLNDPQQAAIRDTLAAGLDGRQIELHGLTVLAGQGAGTPHEVNGTAEYASELPVAGGILHELPSDFGGELEDLVALSIRSGDYFYFG